MTAHQLSNIIAIWTIWFCAAVPLSMLIYYAWKQR